MTIIVDTPPAEEPVALADLKLRLRLDHSHDDALLARLIAAARRHVEARLDLALVTRTLTLHLPWRGERALGLRPRPVSEVTAVSLIRGGEATLLDQAAWTVDIAAKPCRLLLDQGNISMPVRDDVTLAVQLVAGHGQAADVPGELAEAVLQLAAHWYAPEEGLPPEAVVRMLAAHREVRL